MTRKEISLLDAGSWKGFQNVKVVFLDEVLERMKNKVKILIEIKNASPIRVARLIEKSGMIENVIVGSFNLDYIKEIRNISPSISTTLISSGFPETPDVLLENGIPMLDINYRSWKYEKAKEFLSRGITIGFWTIDDVEKMKEAINDGIYFITTNLPNTLCELIKKI
jgi:glycerophosphoryl diester phosphodiesterase